ncbi:MAG: zinc transport system substrate-binding protein [Rhodospirillaceae bacterium]|nr:MAG: zinc transport system substrate-binding protein [Rhodospirillaceae bacterium]
MGKKYAFAIGAALIGLVAPAVPTRAAPRVVVSVVPVQALVASVMAGVGTPRLLVPSGASPHAYALRPSDARALETAELVVLIDPSFETFLTRPLASLAGRARVVRVADLPGVQKRPARGLSWTAHDPHDDAHLPHGGFDPHLWLDPANARRIGAAAATVLMELDPANAAVYQRNAEALDGTLTALDETLRRELAPVAQRPFVVFHDAYQYLEVRYGLTAVGAITVAPERPPGARRLAALRERMRTKGVVCVFREPQFPSRLVETLTEGTGVRVGVLDPLGQPDGYVAMMQANARALRTCLAPEDT